MPCVSELGSYKDAISTIRYRVGLERKDFRKNVSPPSSGLFLPRGFFTLKMEA
jgi:hypothetical protein